MGDSEQVAANIRRFRDEQRMSLGEVARRAGLSKQTLSTIEQGTGNPRVDTLSAIAGALGVSLRRLLTEPDRLTLVARAQGASWRSSNGFQVRALDQTYGIGYVRSQVVRLPPHDRVRVPAHAQGTVHHTFVLKGGLEIGLPTGSTALSEGDFFRYPGDVEHVYAALTPDVELYLVTTLPQSGYAGSGEQAGDREDSSDPVAAP